MKILLWAIGKTHETYIKQGVDLFTKRISHYYPVEWKIFPSPKNNDENQIKKDESVQILHAIQKDDVLVALDENGKQWNSVELAKFIETSANSSIKNLIFLIGGAYGLPESLLKRCNYRWSLSKLVFPHQLVRLILSEQIYRACTIIRNEKYHHL
ncbi:MAG TPA: 23S rRNA (pseudouridine(1915)-N(3))-methyltransferase RlmH [Chitinophagaceae bacterium]|nr:23S rRNA (pseudouridine(1915)-N(3))-methyltransferase RlmH [Chitinophagaceae bacterium]